MPGSLSARTFDKPAFMADWLLIGMATTVAPHSESSTYALGQQVGVYPTCCPDSPMSIRPMPEFSQTCQLTAF